MDPCNQPFGDKTAHATVEWFLSELPKFNNRSTKEKLAFDDFCEGLNSVYFIDCLRHKVKKDKDRNILKNIEHIAKELKKGEKWEEFSNLSILLLSIARTPLKNKDQESTRNALLYCVKEIYNCFNEKSESCNSRSLSCLCNESQSQDEKGVDYCKSRYLVFRAGCQLLSFQDDKDADWKKWKRKFEEFGRKHSEEISKFRMLYYSTDNITVFIHRIVERWKQVRDSTAKEGDFTAQEFKDLDNKYYDLNPLRFELPVQSRGAEAFKFANDFIQKFEKPKANKQTISKDFVRKLANRFRIIQWEILVRDLVAEAGGDRLCFHPISVAHTISGMPEDEDFLTSFIDDTRQIECRFERSYGEIPTNERYNEDRSSKDKIILDENQAEKVKECHKSFEILLPETPNKYYFIHEDLVKSFANVRASDKSTNRSFNTMLIEDGELSFFSLLWLLRYARWTVDKGAKDENSEEWKSKLKKWKSVKKNGELTSRFRLKKKEGSSESFEDNWSECNMQEFAEECGLIILFKKNDQTDDHEDPSQCIRTRRWTSLITWLRRLNDNLRVTDKDDKPRLESVDKLDHSDPLLKRLPIKILDYGKKRTSFIKELREFLASDGLTGMLNTLDKSLSDASTSYKKFTAELGDLVTSLDSLLKVESSAGLDDEVLLRCCRGFIPIEHLIRAYKPCEFHLLFQALNWEESSGHSKQAPISIGCATIAGQVETEPMGESEMSQKTTIGGVETDSDSRDDSESSEVTVTDFDRWVDPYRALFSTLSTNFALPAVRKSGEQIGKITQKHYFAHQTSGLLNTVWSDKNRSQLSFESNFSLWMAKTQVTEIWGGFRIDTREKIHEDRDFNSFSQRMEVDWKALDGRGIVEKLVYLGLHGGIRRSLQSSNRPFARYIATNIFAPLNLSSDQPKKVEQILGNVLDSLSFCLPEDEPPIWVDTKAFSLCFYHGMRQATYHALETFFDDNRKDNPKKPCLGVVWKDQRVFIGNRGKVDSEEHLAPNFKTTDHEYFHLFEKNTEKEFETEGPKPVTIDDAIWEDKWEDEIIWQLMITKENYDEFQLL